MTLEKEPASVVRRRKAKRIVLMALARGKTRGQACAEAKINISTLREWEKTDPEFAESILDAEEMSFDPVEETVRGMAIAGDMAAVKEYRSMKRRREAREARQRQVEVESRHTVTIQAEENIRQLLGTLRRRQQADLLELEKGDVIDVEVQDS